ncbi:MAG: SOS response-associated peptidase family protein [Lysobacterales bacterium]|jgi:putative SOS response-associated peptidase YedK
MCGKTAVYKIAWKTVYAWATSLTPPAALPPDPVDRINVSPSRLRRKSEPGSMVWETLPAIYASGAADQPTEAVWPYLPPWSGGRLPHNRQGRLLSTANARLRHEEQPFAPTFMPAWSRDFRVLVPVSWFYEFDARVQPKIPYAVFPLNAPFWLLCGLASRYTAADGASVISVCIITVEPNEVLKSIGHSRSPAIIRAPADAARWLRGDKQTARRLLRPFPDEEMAVESVPMGIKIPGNEDVDLPASLTDR